MSEMSIIVLVAGPVCKMISSNNLLVNYVLYVIIYSDRDNITWCIYNFRYAGNIIYCLY